MNKFIKFTLPDFSSDAVCSDGQIPGAEKWLSPPTDTGSPGSSTGNPSKSYLIPALGEYLSPFPTGARFLGTHQHADSDDFNILFAIASGLYYLRYNSVSKTLSGPFQIPLDADISPNQLSIADCCRRWVVFILKEEKPIGRISSGNVLYSVWESDETLPAGGHYSIPSGLPESPVVEFSLIDASLEGYVAVAGNYPGVEISVDCPSSIEIPVRDWLIGAGSISEDFYSSAFEKLRSDIGKALSVEWKQYVSSCRRADRHLFPFRVHAAWEIDNHGNDGKFNLSPSPSRLMMDDYSSVNARIDDFSIANGNLTMKIVFSRKPQQLLTGSISQKLPDYLNGEFGFSANLKIIVDDQSDIFANDTGSLDIGALHSVVTGSERGRGWTIKTNPDKVYQSKFVEESVEVTEDFPAIGGLNFNSRLILYNATSIMVSEENFPPLTRSVTRFEGEQIFSLAASLRALSSGQFGDFPLYAFCKDGIRALTATEDGGFRSVQLVSRDVPLHGTFPIATTDGVAISTLRGIVVIDGSHTDVVLSPAAGGDLPVARAWHYPADCLIVEWKDKTIALSDDGKKLLTIKIPCDCEYITYWPLLFATYGGSIFRVSLEEYHEEESAARVGDMPPTLTTRPFKLGAPCKMKTIHYLSLTADGELDGWVIEGSNDMRRWHILGCNESNRPIGLLRGSGWYCFRLVLHKVKALPGGVFMAYSSC